MTLEDSLGDILRKARISNQVSTEAAAQAAGLAVADYEQLEESGVAPAGLQFDPLARLLTLSGSRLADIAQGWRPQPVDLAQWQALEVITTAGEGMTVNAFLLWDPSSRAAALFDTGFDEAPIAEQIEQHSLHLQHIFITHSHGDHVAALGPLRKRYAGVRVHSGSSRAPAEQRLADGSEFAIGALRVTHRATPGHAEDGVTYLMTGWAGQAPAVAVVGDAIFAGSMGGARDQLSLARERVRGMILSLAEDTLICPGHGPLTTVGQEKDHNPWFP
ncbi:MAG: MBL fold metallo-hydrolase [Verrucomicrobiae bacterium]|nr:MBL fold metallo-hydrolase [Verrucomicrobiae bacterium]